MRRTEIDVKLALARQAATKRNIKAIEKRLANMGADLSGSTGRRSYGRCFSCSRVSNDVERIGRAQFAREALALKKNQQFIDFCEAVVIVRPRHVPRAIQ